MDQKIIEYVEEAYKKSDVPVFRVGDTIDIHQKIVEGAKTRIQVFNGVVIGRKGSGLNEMFTVRRIVNNEGVERIFPIHSPLIVKIEVKRSGKTRRAKLYYLRSRVGKARRLRELRKKRVPKKTTQVSTSTEAPETAEAEAVGV